jgi:hypothetical protein
MKRFSSTVSLALAVVAVLGLTSPAAAQHQVPFRGAFEGDYTVTPIPGTPTAMLVVSATGISSQLGAFDLEIPHLVNFATSNAVGSYLMTAANGDMVVGTFTGHATPIGTDGHYAMLVGEVTITGGTGRFVGATGEFTAVPWIDRVNLLTIGYYDGSISNRWGR